MIIDDIKQGLTELCTHILFDYKDVQCGIDPISRSRFDMWYGDKDCTVNSIEGVMNEPLFDGNSLVEIVDHIENIEL